MICVHLGDDAVHLELEAHYFVDKFINEGKVIFLLVVLRSGEDSYDEEENGGFMPIHIENIWLAK